VRSSPCWGFQSRSRNAPSLPTWSREAAGTSVVLIAQADVVPRRIGKSSMRAGPRRRGRPMTLGRWDLERSSSDIGLLTATVAIHRSRYVQHCLECPRFTSIQTWSLARGSTQSTRQCADENYC
jgi:hypothetical protein